MRINVTETANYTCYAINQKVGGGQTSDQRSFMVYAETEEVQGEEQSQEIFSFRSRSLYELDSASSEVFSDYSQGICAPYHGQVCREYLQGRGLVWFNVSKDNSGGWLNEQVTQNIWRDVIENLNEPCRKAAEVPYQDICWNRPRKMLMSSNIFYILSPCCASTRSPTAC